MIELIRIIERFEKLADNEILCLAEVVNVDGSSYRQPGAKMLISSSGSFVGTVSGGCLEGDALKQAKQVISANKSIIKRYDTNDDSIHKISRNLGCNGLIDILFKPIDKNSILLNSLKNDYLSNNSISIATILNDDYIGTQYLLNSNDIFKSESNKFTSFLNEKLKKIKLNKKNYNENIIVDGEELQVFYEYIPKRNKLFIFGSGFDVKPIIILAKNLGWHVTVTSDSYSITIPEDFYPADVIEYVDRAEINDNFEFDEYSFCILISHNYKYDINVLESLLSTNVPYIGILGPKKRFEMMKEELLTKNNFTLDCFDRVFSPTGLDIGGENPDELALSIISEILAVQKSKKGTFLKDKTSRIHA